MKKAAVFSDIHGNLDMLQKAIDICKAQDVEQYIVLGDMISDGPDSQAVLDTVMNLTEHVVRGNREEYILNYHAGKRKQWDNNYQCESLVKTHKNLTDAGLKYISGLPDMKRLNLFGLDTLIVHGSHISVGHFILPCWNIDVFMDMHDRYGCSLYLLGHSHQSYHFDLMGSFFINPGPLGIPPAISVYKREDAFSMGIISIQDKQLVEYRPVYIPYNPAKLKEYYLKDIDSYEHTFWMELIADSFFTKQYDSIKFLHMAKQMAKEKGYENVDPIPNDIWEDASNKWRKEHKGTGIF